MFQNLAHINTPCIKTSEKQWSTGVLLIKPSPAVSTRGDSGVRHRTELVQALLGASETAQHRATSFQGHTGVSLSLLVLNIRYFRKLGQSGIKGQIF